MKFTDFSKTILEKQKKGYSLSSSDYPDSLYFAKDVAKVMKQITEYSNNEGVFSKREGQTGKEYAVQLVFFIDEVYLSGVITGTYQNVMVKEPISAKPEQNGSEVKFNLSIGKKSYKTAAYEVSKVQDILLGVPALIHTHPKVYDNNSKATFSFFSPQDISVVISGSIPVVGIITDQSLWLACRAGATDMIPADKLYEASRKLSDSPDELEKYIKRELKGLGIVFYRGSISGNVKKL
jgi:hypothetical protein